MKSPRPWSAVLFVCAHNSIRSPMAAAIARHYFPRLFVSSAGIWSGEKDPFAQKVMEEIGLSLEKHHPMALEDLEDMSFDGVITLSPEAHHTVMDMTRRYPFEVEYWLTADPTLAMGTREQVLEAYRQVRDGLMKRIKARFVQ